MNEKVQLTAELIEAFAGTFLAASYDDAQPTPDFHREGWKLYCSNAERAGAVAPRGHAKSTAFTHDYTLASVLFRDQEYVVLVGSNEEMGIEMLGDIAREFRENEELIEAFHIEKLLTDSKTDLIVKCRDGHEFRIIARGSGQKMRGRKWKGKRPGLIVCDDLEDDEQVESTDRRAKFRKWFSRALKPMLRKGGKIRIHGTILHEDSLLNRLVKDPTWKMLFYRAHAAFDDFSEILWPQMFSEERLRDIRQSYLEQYDAAGYSQEYLNDPFDNSEAYLRKDDFKDMKEVDLDREKTICVGCDFAVSKKDKANRTSFTVAGQDSDQILHIVDQFVGRWDPLEWVEVMFDINTAWKPEVFFVEDGVIWKSLESLIAREMRERREYFTCMAVTSVKDKATRGRSFQKRHRAHAVRFNKKADWYPSYEMELLRFTGVSEAILDDQFDSTAIVCVGFDKVALTSEEDFMSEEELYQRGHGQDKGGSDGRSPVTGY